MDIQNVKIVKNQDRWYNKVEKKREKKEVRRRIVWMGQVYLSMCIMAFIQCTIWIVCVYGCQAVQLQHRFAVLPANTDNVLRGHGCWLEVKFRQMGSDDELYPDERVWTIRQQLGKVSTLPFLFPVVDVSRRHTARRLFFSANTVRSRLIPPTSDTTEVCKWVHFNFYKKNK